MSGHWLISAPEYGIVNRLLQFNNIFCLAMNFQMNLLFQWARPRPGGKVIQLTCLPRPRAPRSPPASVVVSSVSLQTDTAYRDSTTNSHNDNIYVWTVVRSPKNDMNGRVTKLQRSMLFFSYRNTFGLSLDDINRSAREVTSVKWKLLWAIVGIGYCAISCLIVACITKVSLKGSSMVHRWQD